MTCKPSERVLPQYKVMAQGGLCTFQFGTLALPYSDIKLAAP
jgi:hypothetical protein